MKDMNLHFTTRFSFEHPKHFSEKFINYSENYWSLGSRQAKILSSKDKTIVFRHIDTPLSKKKKFKAVLLRVALGATGIIPLVTLFAKLHFRKTHAFKEERKLESNLQEPTLSSQLPPEIVEPKKLKFPEDFSNFSSNEELFEFLEKNGELLCQASLEGGSLTDELLEKFLSLSPNIEKLSLDCVKITNIEAIKHLKNLKELEIKKCHYLGGEFDLSSFKKLENLRISGCSSMKNPPKLSACTDLKSVYLSENDGLKKGPDFSGLEHLEEVSLARCNEMETVPLFKGCSSLKMVDMEANHKLIVGPDLTDSQMLKTIRFGACDRMIKGPILKGCVSLEEADFAYCSSLEEIDFSDSIHLREVRFLQCASLKNAPILKHCSYLEYVNFAECSILESDLDFSGLEKLQRVCLQKTSIKKVPNFKKCIALEEVQLSSSQILKEGSTQYIRIYYKVDFNFSKAMREAAKLQGCKVVDLAQFAKMSIQDFTNLIYLSLIGKKKNMLSDSEPQFMQIMQTAEFKKLLSRHWDIKMFQSDPFSPNAYLWGEGSYIGTTIYYL